jgi:hypothetical protein
MAQFQLSITKTFVFDTDTVDQPTRDAFYAILKEVGWDEKGQPSTTQCEAAMRELLEADDSDDFWEEHIDLDEIGPQDVKIVNFSRQFDRFGPAGQVQEKEKPDVKTPPVGQQEVASKPEATASKVLHPAKAPTTPAPKTSGPGAVIQGARDSTQVKK